MWDATRRLAGFLTVGGLFGLFKRKDAAPPRVDVHVAEVAAPPAPAPEPTAPTHALHRDVLFKGLHEDVNPSASVRPGQMTCQSCDTSFRYFMNSNGNKTVCRCPSCGRQYRV